jgi:hypothetical protein
VEPCSRNRGRLGRGEEEVSGDLGAGQQRSVARLDSGVEGAVVSAYISLYNMTYRRRYHAAGT